MNLHKTLIGTDIDAYSYYTPEFRIRRLDVVTCICYMGALIGRKGFEMKNIFAALPILIMGSIEVANCTAILKREQHEDMQESRLRKGCRIYLEYLEKRNRIKMKDEKFYDDWSPDAKKKVGNLFNKYKISENTYRAQLSSCIKKSRMLCRG